MFKKDPKSIEQFSRGEIAKTILKGLAIGGFVGITIFAPNALQIVNLFKPKNYRERARIKYALNTLHKKSYVKYSPTKNNPSILITSQGLKKAREYSLDNLKIYEPKKWDKNWRMVLFDIPEKLRRSRREVSFRLKDIGFFPYQDSAFVIPYECRREVNIISEHFFVKKYIKYLTIKTMEDEKMLKKHFCLQ